MSRYVSGIIQIGVDDYIILLLIVWFHHKIHITSQFDCLSWLSTLFCA